MAQLLGLALPAQGCAPFEGSVLIIGAGAAGLSAGYQLGRLGIAYQILEAAPQHGGRMKRTTEFVDFPISLGAEWLHVGTEVLDEIVDAAVPVTVETTPYDPNEDTALYEGEPISIAEAGFDGDRKFIGSSWFDFFEQYVVPSVVDNIVYETPATRIEYGGEQVIVHTAGDSFSADRVLITVPLAVLKRGDLVFDPPLSGTKSSAIEQARVWDGCKAFIEFSQKFYPALVEYEVDAASPGQKLYYDAAYGQDSSRHVLGLFAVGSASQDYRERSEDERLAFMLAELDAVFEGQASASYIQHLFQDWNAEPFIHGAYLFDEENWQRVRTLGQPVDRKLYFAGEAYTDGNDWGSVHAAALAARRAVEQIAG